MDEKTEEVDRESVDSASSSTSKERAPAMKKIALAKGVYLSQVLDDETKEFDF